MVALLIAAMLTATPLDVDATTLDERTVHGELLSIGADALTIKSGEDEVSLPLAKLQSVVSTKAPTGSALKPSLWIDLTDGSRLPISAFSAKQGKASVTLLGGLHLELPFSKLRRVQLLAQDESISELWNDVATAKLTGDAVVVRKGGDGRPVVLDFLEGAVGDVSDASIAFTLDGDTININRQKVKVEGIVFYRPASEKMPAVCRVDDASGASWSAKSLALDGDNLKLITVSGLEQSLPLASVTQFDFSLGKIVFLSDLAPLKSDWQPYLSTANLVEGARQMFGLRRDKTFSGKVLTLGETKFRKGLAVHSRSDVAYRLPGNFSRFVATAGIDPTQRSRGNVRLEIRGDDRVLFDQPIAGGSPPLQLDLDVTSVGRLTILVDYGEGLDIGDQLILGNARLIR
jgi:hypothetical protein